MVVSERITALKNFGTTGWITGGLNAFYPLVLVFHETKILENTCPCNKSQDHESQF